MAGAFLGLVFLFGASIGSFVFISMSQIRTTPNMTNGNAPRETSKPQSNASAIPGSVRCPKGPATSAIRRLSINEPR